MNLKPIRTEAEQAEALADIERLWDAPEGSQEADHLEVLVMLVEAYERAHFPVEAPDPARVRGAAVTFEPGARTAWHTHPLGQTLIVTGGCGWAQREGGPVEEIHPGDVVWFAPGEKHWHGATATTGMTHIALQEALDGKVVEWLEQVSAAEYAR